MTSADRHRRWLRWGRIATLVVLISFAFSNIDLRQLLAGIAGASRLRLLAAFVAGWALPIVISAWRWQIALDKLYGIREPFPHLLRRFWIGLFVGYLVPGGLGTDIYRIANSASMSGSLRVHAAVVIGEKVIAVLANGIVLVVAFPFAIRWFAHESSTDQFRAPLRYFALILALMFAVIMWSRTDGFRLLFSRIGAGVGRRVERLAHAAGRPVDAVGKTSRIRDLVRPFFILQNQFLLFSVSLFNQIVSSVGGMLLMDAIGVHLPLVVHLFIWTCMFFVFLLPISFGTIGVRESTYVLAFGLFGIGREPALAGSFLGLGCLLATVGFGGILMLFDGSRSNSDPPLQFFRRALIRLRERSP